MNQHELYGCNGIDETYQEDGELKEISKAGAVRQGNGDFRCRDKRAVWCHDDFAVRSGFWRCHRASRRTEDAVRRLAALTERMDDVKILSSQ